MHTSTPAERRVDCNSKACALCFNTKTADVGRPSSRGSCKPDFPDTDLFAILLQDANTMALETTSRWPQSMWRHAFPLYHQLLKRTSVPQLPNR